MVRQISDTQEKWLATTALVLLIGFVLTMHIPGAPRSGLCLTLTSARATSDAVCLAFCCSAALTALGGIAALWLRRSR